MLDVIRGTIVVAISVLIVLFLLDRFFKIKVRFETEAAAKSRAELLRKHKRTIRHQEQEALQEIIDENIAKIRLDFQRNLTKMEKHVNDELSKVLAAELAEHKKSANSVKTAAVQAIEQSVETFEHNQATIDKQVAEQVKTVKESLVSKLESNMAEILRFYVEAVVRDQYAVEDQVSVIINELEKDKQRIIRDINEST